MGRTFNLLVRSLGLSDLRDTQCGFKLLRGAAARALFAQMTVDGFAFDVELLSLARTLGYRVVETGVVWRDGQRSAVQLLRDPANMLVDVVKLRLRRPPRHPSTRVSESTKHH
jgi:dolichyl-phosphate beta-glucosyltransferase